MGTCVANRCSMPCSGAGPTPRISPAPVMPDTCAISARQPAKEPHESVHPVRCASGRGAPQAEIGPWRTSSGHGRPPGGSQCAPVWRNGSGRGAKVAQAQKTKGKRTGRVSGGRPQSPPRGQPRSGGGKHSLLHKKKDSDLLSFFCGA